MVSRLAVFQGRRPHGNRPVGYRVIALRGLWARLLGVPHGEPRMLAQDIMTTDVVTVAPDTPLTVVTGVLLDQRISGVPVVEADGRPVGMVTEGDLLRRPEMGSERREPWWRHLLTTPEEKADAYVKTHGEHAGDVMSEDLVFVRRDTPVAKIVELLEKHRIRRVPVIEGGKLVGVVSRADIIRALTRLMARRGAPGQAGDEELRRRALDAIHEVKLAGDAFVNVEVTGGVVHLWGFATSAQEREALKVACGNVPGVARVASHLGVFDVATS